MRRAISYAEPKAAPAGKVRTWSFIYTPASDLPKGAHLKFDLNSKGRDFDWEIPQTNLKSKKNLIWMESGDKKNIQAEEVFSRMEGLKGSPYTHGLKFFLLWTPRE